MFASAYNLVHADFIYHRSATNIIHPRGMLQNKTLGLEPRPGIVELVGSWSSGGPYEAKVVACSNYDACYTSEAGGWRGMLRYVHDHLGICKSSTSLTSENLRMISLGIWNNFTVSIATSNSLTEDHALHHVMERE